MRYKGVTQSKAIYNVLLAIRKQLSSLQYTNGGLFLNKKKAFNAVRQMKVLAETLLTSPEMKLSEDVYSTFRSVWFSVRSIAENFQLAIEWYQKPKSDSVQDMKLRKETALSYERSISDRAERLYGQINDAIDALMNTKR